MVDKDLFVLVLWTKVASALKVLRAMNESLLGLVTEQSIPDQLCGVVYKMTNYDFMTQCNLSILHFRSYHTLCMYFTGNYPPSADFRGHIL